MGCGHMCTEVPHNHPRPQSMKAEYLTLLEILSFVRSAIAGKNAYCRSKYQSDGFSVYHPHVSIFM